jgi:hypothetical protein
LLSKARELYKSPVAPLSDEIILITTDLESACEEAATIGLLGLGERTGQGPLEIFEEIM